MMTRQILAGSAVLILLTLGFGAQSFALPMADNSQENILANAAKGNLNSNGQEYILVSVAPIHKGGHATYQLIPKPILGIDGITTSPASEQSQMILVATPPTHRGDSVTYHWIQKPAPNPFDSSS